MAVVIERITAANTRGSDRYGHEFRYHLAAGFMQPGDTVLDAACGTGYGAVILGAPRYVGVDQLVISSREESQRFVSADLQSWTPDFEFEVGVSFETIEHLVDFSLHISVLKRAQKWVLASVPVVPTVGMNPFHHHDFRSGDLERLFADECWELFQTVQQPSEEAEISVFRRR